MGPQDKRMATTEEIEKKEGEEPPAKFDALGGDLVCTGGAHFTFGLPNSVNIGLL